MIALNTTQLLALMAATLEAGDRAYAADGVLPSQVYVARAGALFNAAREHVTAAERAEREATAAAYLARVETVRAAEARLQNGTGTPEDEECVQEYYA
jgi:hypothetical protein